MARNNGSNGNGGVSVDFAAVAADMKARASRLTEIGKEQAKLDKQYALLDEQQAAFDAEVAALTGNTPAEPKTRKPRKARANGTPSTRTTLRDVLLSVLPGPDAPAISKDEIATLVAATGYKTKSEDPKVVIGQALGKYRDFQNTERGVWRLTQHGVNARDKATAAPAADAPAAEQTPTETSTEAPAAAEQTATA
jgi:hypothetical protein